MKKRNKTTRYIAIFMLAIIAIIAIALVVIGLCSFNYVFIEDSFWFDLSGFSLTAQSAIRGITGLLATFVPMGIGVAIMINLVGEENVIKFWDKIME